MKSSTAHTQCSSQPGSIQQDADQDVTNRDGSKQDTAGSQNLSEERKVIEREVYDRIYSTNSIFANPDIREGLLHASEDAFRQRLAVLCSGARVLEIGCGAAEHSIFAAQHGAASVIGIDISSAAVTVASNRAAQAGVAERCRFEVIDLEHLPYPAGSFDLIIDHEVFSSIDLDKAAPELWRVLRPGGCLLGIECFAHNPLFNLNRALGVRRGRRTHWMAAHIFSRRDVRTLRGLFSAIHLQYFHLLTLAVAPLRGYTAAARVIRLLERIDRLILALPVLRNLAFKVVFEARR
jgi:ubiquinone/menaquinone biosynthesis C-methylase UbiE